MIEIMAVIAIISGMAFIGLTVRKFFKTVHMKKAIENKDDIGVC